uniref:Fatty acyl-CoA reductase n=1 Tax=Aceria tosichella TaxID=561515 RepID=A0A6G1SKA6_9ACAR
MQSNKVNKVRRASASEEEQQMPPPPTPSDVCDQSQIVEFYAGRCVLVTGGSGFLGKLIIEKLLRTCTEIRKIFVLIRPKKNKSPHERLNELLKSAIFDRLKLECNEPDSPRSSFEQLRSKLIVLEGCLEEPYLGLNAEQLLQLADEVSVIIHSAAIVSFVGKLRLSTDVNLLGTYNVLELACKLPKLCALIHVSTSYSNCVRKTVNEHIYPVNINPLSLLELAKILEDSLFESLRSKLIGQHPNNYTYTKQLAENLCAQFAVGPHQLPVLVCRPSIIVSTLDEPIKGFVDNRNAGNGVFDGVTRGLLHAIQGREEALMDLVPADLVSNCVIALAWFADLYHKVRLRKERPAESYTNNSRIQIDSPELERKMIKYYEVRKDIVLPMATRVGLDEALAQVPVVHVTSGVENPVTYAKMMSLISEQTLKYPSTDLFRKPGTSIIENYYLHRIACALSHTLKGKLMDYFCKPPQVFIGSGKSKMVSSWSMQFARCDNLMSVLPYFFMNSFKFDPNSRQKLIDEFMNNEDRRLFNCDFRRLDWSSYSRDITLGIRRHLIGESDDTLPMARQRLKYTLWRNSLIQIMSIALISYIFYMLLF